jgi:hypothetical protein
MSLSSGKGAATAAGSLSLAPVDLSKLDPAVARAAQSAALVNKSLGITGPTKISGFNGIYSQNGSVVSTRADIKAGPGGPTQPSYHKASEMKFNLPPHEWSLPRNFSDLNNISNTTPKPVNHSLRRAMMWYYDSSDAVGGTQLQIPAGATISAPATGTTSAAVTIEDNYWGFQFLWNPENLQNVLTRNSNVVPSVMDKFANQGGLFTAMEGLQFTIVIDRRNDFACFRGTANPSSYASYYTAAGTAGIPVKDYGPMINDLMKLGTMADVEYIYRMINGSGQQGRPWINALGRKTADLAFLAPTAIALQFGPSTDNSLSYVGWIESLNVNHTAFTSDMIPIHTDVQVTFNAFSRVALGSKN